MNFEELISDVSNLRHRQTRLTASKAIAKRFGANDLLFFVEDPLLKVLLPVEGYPQQLPVAKDWRAFLEAARKSEAVVCDLRCPYTEEFRTVRGFHLAENSMLVFVGAPPKLSLSKNLRAIFSMAAASFAGEAALTHSQKQTEILRESAVVYKALVASLDSTKSKLQATLNERDQALLSHRRQNEADAKLLNGTQTLLSTLDFRTTLKNVVQIAVQNIADWCFLYLADSNEEGSKMHFAEMAAREPADERNLASYLKLCQSVTKGPSPVGQVIESKTEKYFSGLSRERILALSNSEAEGEALFQCKPGFIVVQPMIMSGDLIGILSYGFRAGGFELSTQDFLLVQRWTAQSTMAISNATLLQEAQMAVRARDELMSISSHEIRTPITAMKLQVQLMKRQIEKLGVESIAPEKFVKLVDQSDSQLRKLSRLVEDMLDLSRINTGHFSFSLGKINLSDVVSETLDRLLPNLVSAGCSVRVHIAPDIFVEGDVSRIEQVLTNLLTNAARYGAGKPVRLTLKKVAGMAELRVQDEGQGIRTEDLERIFEKFERAISRNEVSGLGLGLFIVRQILIAHKGSIRAESKFGEGAVFITTIPLVEENSRQLDVQ